MSEFIDINESIAVNMDNIIRIERGDDGKSMIYVNSGGKSDCLKSDIPYNVLRLLVKSKSGESEKYLKQLAQQSQTYRG